MLANSGTAGTGTTQPIESAPPRRHQIVLALDHEGLGVVAQEEQRSLVGYLEWHCLGIELPVSVHVAGPNKHHEPDQGASDCVAHYLSPGSNRSAYCIPSSPR